MIRDILERLRGDGLGALFARGIGGSFIVRATGSAVFFAMHVLLARVLGAAEYGVYVLVFTSTMILVYFANAGMFQTMVRFVAEYVGHEDWGRLRGLLLAGFGLVLAAGIIILLGSSGIVWFFRDAWGMDIVMTCWLAFAGLPLIALLQACEGVLQGLNRIVQGLLATVLLRPTLVVCFVGGASLVGIELSAVNAMALTFAATSVVFLVGLFMVLRFLPRQIMSYNPEYEVGNWFRVGGALLFMAGMNLILRQMDILMIGGMISAKEAGLYNSAVRLVDLVTFGSVAVGTAMAPLISELYSAGRKEDVQKMMIFASRITSAFAFLSSMFLFFFGRWVLGFFGLEFVGAYLPLILLLVGQVALAFMGPANTLLTMIGREGDAMRIFALVTGMNVVLNIALIPVFGMNGAALATTICAVLWSGLLFASIRKRLGINPTIFALLFSSRLGFFKKRSILGRRDG